MSGRQVAPNGGSTWELPGSWTRERLRQRALHVVDQHLGGGRCEHCPEGATVPADCPAWRAWYPWITPASLSD